MASSTDRRVVEEGLQDRPQPTDPQRQPSDERPMPSPEQRQPSDPQSGTSSWESARSIRECLSPGLRITVRNTFLTVEGDEDDDTATAVPEGHRRSRTSTAPASLFKRVRSRSQEARASPCDDDEHTDANDPKDTCHSESSGTATPRSDVETSTPPTENRTILLQIPLMLSLFQGSALSRAADDVSVLVMQTGNDSNSGAPYVDLRVTFGGQRALERPPQTASSQEVRPAVPPESPPTVSSDSSYDAECRHWKNKGWCRFQDSCKFLHTPSKRGVGLLDMPGNTAATVCPPATATALSPSATSHRGSRGCSSAGVASAPVARTRLTSDQWVLSP
mmetsp:Transcript_19099/g.44674  ORF Transcript_19099/g.44674 Transcript_19099/m.44674 type:complete len:334 (-) Transcript_19099:63-1064(-)